MIPTIIEKAFIGGVVHVFAGQNVGVGVVPHRANQRRTGNQ
jgi:hypothetical protein